MISLLPFIYLCNVQFYLVQICQVREGDIVFVGVLPQACWVQDVRRHPADCFGHLDSFSNYSTVLKLASASEFTQDLFCTYLAASLSWHVNYTNTTNIWVSAWPCTYSIASWWGVLYLEVKNWCSGDVGIRELARVDCIDDGPSMLQPDAASHSIPACIEQGMKRRPHQRKRDV